MASFPDNLPPEGLDTVTKLFIYFGIFYIVLTAITTWLITRRRSFPKQVSQTTQTQQTTQTETVMQTTGITETISFNDTKDKLSSLKVEIKGAEASLSKLNGVKEELSPEVYNKLSEEYNSRVSKLSDQMNEMLQSNIETSSGEISEGVSDDEMESIEADLEKQLMDLDNDDFLSSRPKKDIDEIFEEDTSSTPAQPTATTPKASAPAPPTQEKRVPMPPPSKKSTPAPPPPSSASASAPSTPKASAPAPPTQEKRVPMPPPPSKKSTPAPPPPSSASANAPSTPKAAPPSASQPKSNQPLSAAQPMKVQSEDEEGMFAKSTSIAALRMDMLRELARLKKLIPEDQDKDQ